MRSSRPKPRLLPRALSLPTKLCACGDFYLEVVGESHYQAELRLLQERRPGTYKATFVLVPEPDNEYDPKAVGVWAEGIGVVGHLPKAIACQVQPYLLRFQEEHGAVVACRGRMYGRDRSRPNIGVWLDLDCGEIGLEELELGENYRRMWTVREP